MTNDEKLKLFDDTITKLYYNIISKENLYLKSKKINLTLTEVRTLSVISKANDRTISGIADELGVTPGTFSVSVDKLISKGYIKRINDEYDKRKVLIDITSKSLPILELYNRYHQKLLAHFVSLHNIDLDLLNDSLMKMNDFLDKEAFYE